MKTKTTRYHITLLVTVITLYFQFCTPAHSQTVDPFMVTIVAEVYQTKRASAEPFLRADHVDALQFLAALQKLGQGFNSTTTITKLPAITTKSGQRAISKGKDTTLEVEPVVGPDGQTVDLVAALTVGEKQLTTTATAKFGGAIFLGSLDGSTSDSAQFAFLRIIKQ
jgi:hypothetical protein